MELTVNVEIILSCQSKRGLEELGETELAAVERHFVTNFISVKVPRSDGASWRLETGDWRGEPLESIRQWLFIAITGGEAETVRTGDT